MIGIFLCIAVVGVVSILLINNHVKAAAEGRILSIKQAAELEDVDCIIVLGCQVRDDGSLSHMLRDRLMRGLEVYNAGAAPKLLMSGDHGREDYDEVGAMKNCATENGVPSENVFMDHAGFSAYESRTFIILYKPNYGNRTVVESGVLRAFRGRKDSFNS